MFRIIYNLLEEYGLGLLLITELKEMTIAPKRVSYIYWPMENP